MIMLDNCTFKVLSHIVKIGSGDALHSSWYRKKHPGGMICGLSVWVKVDNKEDIRPRCHDMATIKEYLDIVETEKDFQDWYDMFIK